MHHADRTNKTTEPTHWPASMSTDPIWASLATNFPRLRHLKVAVQSAPYLQTGSRQGSNEATETLLSYEGFHYSNSNSIGNNKTNNDTAEQITAEELRKNWLAPVAKIMRNNQLRTSEIVVHRSYLQQLFATEDVRGFTVDGCRVRSFKAGRELELANALLCLRDRSLGRRGWLISQPQTQAQVRAQTQVEAEARQHVTDAAAAAAAAATMTTVVWLREASQAQIALI